MHKWYVVQVMSSHEKKVKKTLEENRDARNLPNMIEEIVLPVENVSEVKQGQTRIVEKRLWPGYLLIKMNLDEQAWQYIKNTAGVIDFLGGGTPTALSDKEVEEILRDLADKQQKVTQRHKFEVGDRVKIIDGVFINFIGTVIEVFHDKGRLSVMVSIFGRDTRVDDLEFTQVEEITEEANT
jgi:transcription termination/antitermination protein NusG